MARPERARWRVAAGLYPAATQTPAFGPDLRRGTVTWSSGQQVEGETAPTAVLDGRVASPGCRAPADRRDLCVGRHGPGAEEVCVAVTAYDWVRPDNAALLLLGREDVLVVAGDGEFTNGGKIGSNTSFKDACTTRSEIVAIPSRRNLPPTLGIIRSRTGSGRKLRSLMLSRSPPRNSSTPVRATMDAAVRPSTPAVFAPLLPRTRSHATSKNAGSATRL